MAQTPISATALISSTTPTTLYTVPAGATAVVKSVLTSSLLGNFPTMTVNKVVGGTTYPIVVDATSGYNSATNFPQNKTVNALSGPVTLTAGQSLSVSTTTSPAYKFPTTYSPNTNLGQRINNMNYLNGQYIAVGYDNSVQLGLVLTSPDGITWTKQTFPYFMTITDIGFDGTNYVVCGISNQGFIYYSTNLSSWTQVASGTSTNMYCITYGNSKWLMGGANGVYAYATTPTSWTVGTMTDGQLINAVLVIGTNFAFGTDGTYKYTADFTTFTAPYVAPVSSTGNNFAFAIDAAGKVYSQNSNNPNANPATSLYQSTNNAKTFTAIDFTGLAGTNPTDSGPVYSFGNGGRIYWMFNHPSNSRYLASSDGVTWSNQTYSGTYSSQSGSWYSSNLFTMLGTTTATSVMFNWQYSASQVLINPVSSSGIVGSAGVAFASSGTYIAPNNNGYLVPIGNRNSGSWVAISVNEGNTQYARMWTGTSYTAGSDTTYSTNVFYIAGYGGPISCCTRPASNGFIIGTSSGYILASTSGTGGFSLITNNGQGSSVVGLAANGDTATSKIVAVYANGYTYYSVNQGTTWSAGGVISDSFINIGFSNGGTIQYANGTWIIYSFNNGGVFYYSTDGINWISNPLAIKNMYTLNSNNIFLMADGINYTTGTSPDNFGLKNTTFGAGDYGSVRRMVYVGSTYFVGIAGSIYQSTNLASWTGSSTSSTQINNLTFYASGYSSATSIAYSGSGSTFAVGNALRNQTTDNVSFGQPTALATALVAAVTTVGIVEIT